MVSDNATLADSSDAFFDKTTSVHPPGQSGLYHASPLVEPGESLPQRVIRLLQRELESGRLKVGDRLPSEPKLAKLLGVSRATLREGLQLLAAEGIISRQDGIGTFVTGAHATPIVPGVEELFGAVELIRRAGFEPRVSNVQVERCIPPELVNRTLGLEGHERVYRLFRVFLVQQDTDVPVTVSTDYIALLPNEDPHAVETFDGYSSLGELLRRVYDIDFEYAVGEMLTRPADAQLGELLQVPTGHPLLAWNQTHMASNGRRAFYSESLHNTDVLRFRLVRRRRGVQAVPNNPDARTSGSTGLD